MKCIEKLMIDIYNSSKIPFQLIIDEVEEYTSLDFDILQEFNEKIFNYKDTKCCIKVNAAFSVAIDLLEFCIKEKLNEVFVQKKNIISSLLKGKSIDRNVIKTIWPTIIKDFNLINIYIENYSDEVMFFIEESYSESDIEVMFFNNNILLIGNIEDVLDHAMSIKETIINSISGKCYISYCEVKDYLNLKEAYEVSLYKINLAIKYKVTEGIFNENSLMLEGIVDSISDDIKNDIYTKFNEGISNLDNEMIKTVDVFFKCGLNLSDAARELYIHRNTLIYRLDKIEKNVKCDIRNFNNAILFKIVFFIWMEKKQNNT